MKTSYILFKLFCTSGILFSSLAQAYEINVKTLGNLELGGALTGYYLSGEKIARENKKSRVDIASAVITLNKKVAVGINHTKSTDYMIFYGLKLFKSIKTQVSEKTRAYGLALHLGVEHLFYKIATPL